jgi:hypothetical protein
MSVELTHTIVRAHDKHVSARFLADILGLPVGAEVGPFVPIQLANGVTLDYMTVAEPQPQHYAFQVDDDFDAAFARIQQVGVHFYAEPGGGQPGHINHRWGGPPTASAGAVRHSCAPTDSSPGAPPSHPPDTHATLRNVLTHLLAQPTPRHQRQGMSNAPPLNTKNGTDGGHDLSAERPLH